MNDRYTALERSVLEQRAGAAPMALGKVTPLAHAQSQLAAHGFDAGTPDGTLKPQTTKAITGFQVAKKIPVTGTLDSATKAALAKPPLPAGGMPAAMRGGPIQVSRGPGSAPSAPAPARSFTPKAPPSLGVPATPPPAVAVVVASSAPHDPVAIHLAGSLTYPVGRPPRALPRPMLPRLPSPMASPPAARPGGAAPAAHPRVSFPRSPAPPASRAMPQGSPPPRALPAPASARTFAPKSAPAMHPTGPKPGAAMSGRNPGAASGAPNQTFSSAAPSSGSPTLVHTGGAPGARAPSFSQSKERHMEGYENAGRRVPARFSTPSTVAAAAQTNVVVTPQIPFRGENLVVDAATAAFFSLRELKVGTWPQNAGGEADLPCTIFSPVQAGAVNYEMDLCDAGTQITVTVVNTDSAAHAFVCAIFGHEIKKAA